MTIPKLVIKMAQHCLKDQKKSPHHLGDCSVREIFEPTWLERRVVLRWLVCQIFDTKSICDCWFQSSWWELFRDATFLTNSWSSFSFFILLSYDENSESGSQYQRNVLLPLLPIDKKLTDYTAVRLFFVHMNGPCKVSPCCKMTSKVTLSTL